MRKVSDEIYCFSGGNDNAYLIKGEINVLIDGVKSEFEKEYIKEVNEIVPITDIKYIVMNHSEPDRSGTFEAVLRENPDIIVIASTAGLKFLGELTERNFNTMLAKDNMELSINGGIMRFLLVPYLNWPDSMMTLYKTSLFSCDVLSNVDNNTEEYAKKYLMSHGQSLKSALEIIKGQEIDLILTGTGNALLNAELSYKSDENSCKILILYSSVYGNTKEMADVVFSVLSEHGMDAEMYDMEKLDTSEAADKINKCKAIVLGINTINADAPKKLWSIIGETDKLRNKHKPCMIFGTYGWSGEGLFYTEHHLKLLRYEVFDKPFGIVLKMKTADSQKLREYTDKFIEFINESR